MPPRSQSSPFEGLDEAFAPALALARAGSFEPALTAVADRLGHGEPHPRRAAAAATVLVQIARLAESAGQSIAALQAIEGALDACPRWPDLHVQRARLLLARPGRELSQRTAARRALETALKLHPGYAAARFELSMLDAAEGRLGEALDTLRALAREHRGAETVTFERGLDYLRHAEWETAATVLSDALQLPGTTADPLGPAREALAHDAPERALQLAHAALPMCEAWPDAHLTIGAAALQLGHLDDALVAFARALELNPELHAARLQLARALEGLGQTAQAAEQVALVLQRDAAHPEALAMQARAHPALARTLSRSRQSR